MVTLATHLLLYLVTLWRRGSIFRFNWVAHSRLSVLVPVFLGPSGERGGEEGRVGGGGGRVGRHIGPQ